MELRAPDNRVLDAVLAQPKRVALLVYLAVARPIGFHRRDRLLALFWPELDDARARDALSQALRFLRQSLGSEVIVTRGADEIGVDAARLWCDAPAFRAALDSGQLDDALRLYEGDFLDGFFAEESSGFAEWVESERGSLREVAARGARKLAEMHGDHGDHTTAVAWGRRAAELTPDDERAFRRLLGFLDGAGDRAGALQAYEAFARRLRAEYGAEPAAETRAIIDAIRREAAGAAIRPAAAAPPDRAAPWPAVTSPPHAHESLGSEPFGPGASLADGRYVIERVLGVGGMATVYLARDVRHQRQVAVKVLKPTVVPAVDAEGLLREIRIAANLQNPHIVPLFDSGEIDGQVFYVMPYVMGESLGARLRRDPSMPLDLALRIARNIARALAYAHVQGIVHRDIKPDNVLLSGDATGELHAMVSDFGVAKAINASRSRASLSGDRTLTPYGGMVGTPRYMSPEQAVGDAVDCRADLYAWGVLTYEMLAGAHPFDAQLTPRQVIAAHISTDPEPLSSRREDVPASVASLVMQCLEKEPERRPADGVALVAALDDNLLPPVLPVERRPRRRLQWLAGVAAVVVLGGGVWASGLWRARAPKGAFGAEATTKAAALDTSRYAVLPFVYDSVVVTDRNEAARLRDAFSSWNGVTLVDEFQLGEAVSRHPSNRLTSADAQRVATGLGAGRYVRGDVQAFGTSVRLYVALYDTRTNTRVRDTTLRFGDAAAETDSLFARLADHLLFGLERRLDRSGARAGTRSLPARQAFVGAQAALERWDLPAADSQFLAATRFDVAYAQAWLWLAQVRWWRRTPNVEWKDAAERAVAAHEHLSSRDRDLAGALVAASQGDLVRACAALLAITRVDQYDFAAWYSASDCLARDDAVVRDPTSPSGWRFRASYHQSILTYRRALRLLPSIHRALRDRGFYSLRVRLRTAPNFTREGHGPPEAGRFFAYPAWQGDTLAFIPYPEARFWSADASVIPSTLTEAALQQRSVFHDIAATWAATFPDSPDAQEALALSLQLLGDPAALDTVRRARRLASDPNDRVRLAALESWTRLRLGFPADLSQLRAARQLADSLLRETHADSLDDVRPLASLAALTGRANLAARLSRHRSVRVEWGVPAALSDVAPQLWVFSAFGGPADSLETLERRFDQQRRTRLSADDASSAADAWLTRASLLAFPEYRFASLARDTSTGMPSGYYLRTALAALIAGDTSTPRRILRDVAQARRRTQPADRAIDALYTEARILEQIGDRRAAAEWLDPTLDTVASADPVLLADPMSAAPLIRAMALRADLAAALGDRATARRWATIVTVFWSDADAFLRPLVNRMIEYTK